jgi:hypothetical protein
MHAIKSPDNELVTINLEAVCHDCKHRHRITGTPDTWLNRMSEWEVKHRQHNVEFLSHNRLIPAGFDDEIFEQNGQAPWWLDYKHNADIKLAYAADAAFTITLASLASSSTWVAGREATSVSNGSNKYVDYEITGFITTGTSPTVGDMRLYGIKPTEDTPTWPDVFDGTDSAETVTNTNILDRLSLLWSGTNSTTSNVNYPIVGAMTLAQAWGLVPKDFTIFVAHSTVAALNSTGGNHAIYYRGIYLTSI